MGLNEIMKGLTKEEQVRTSEDILKLLPGMGSFIGGTGENYSENKIIDKEKTNLADKNILRKRELEKMDLDDSTAIAEFIDKQPLEDQKSVIKAVESIYKSKDITEKSWYLKLKALPSEIQSIIFMKRYNKVSSEKQIEMMETAQRLGISVKSIFGKEELKNK
jgi:hypothetical protein